MQFLYILCFYIFTKNIFSAYYNLILLIKGEYNPVGLKKNGKFYMFL